MLLHSELQTIKTELGYHLISVQGEPYVQYIAIFEQIIQPYLDSGPSTTSNTVVITPGALPTQVTLTLASVVGISPGTVLVVDVDSLAETVTVQYVSGSTVSVLLGKPHSGTYPVKIQASGVYTSSSTIVAAISSPPAPVALTVANPALFTVGSRVVVDSGARQEVAEILDITGSTFSLLLSKGHSGTYPISQESGVTIVRGILGKLRSIADVLNGGAPDGGTDALSFAQDGVGIKKVDEIEFFGAMSSAGGKSLAGNTLQQLLALREYWRDELASCLNLPRLNAACGGSISVY